MIRSILQFCMLSIVMVTMTVRLSFAATPPQQRFEKANALYKQQQYTQAAAQYQQLIDEGYLSAELYLNAGNAYYKSSAMGEAIYSYEKAQQIDPGNEAVGRNLALANQKIGSTAQSLPLLFFERWWMDLQRLHSTNGWAIGTIVLCWILIIVFAVHRFISRSILLRIAGYLTAALFIGYFAMAAWVYNRAQHQDIGIVMHGMAKVKAAPDANSKELFEVKEGIRLDVVDRTATFYKVALNDGKTGWVPVESIKTL